MFAQGWVRLFTLEADGVPVAVLYCYAYAGHYYFYQGGWDPTYAPYRVGLVLMHNAIVHAVAEGAHIFDFLRGEEAYKDRWATRRTTSVRLIGWTRPGLRFLSAAQELVERVTTHRSGRKAAIGAASWPADSTMEPDGPQRELGWGEA